jgi:5-methylcytosine-specific restriction endonuclease McrA
MSGFSTIPRVSARPRRKRNQWIVGNDLGPVPIARKPKVLQPCAYCGKAPGTTQDHVVPKSFYRRKRIAVPAALSGTVPCCPPCNLLKVTRRLIPRTWRHLIPLLTETFPGTPWRVWTGDVNEPAYRETHVFQAPPRAEDDSRANTQIDSERGSPTSMRSESWEVSA